MLHHFHLCTGVVYKAKTRGCRVNRHTHNTHSVRNTILQQLTIRNSSSPVHLNEKKQPLDDCYHCPLCARIDPGCNEEKQCENRKENGWCSIFLEGKSWTPKKHRKQRQNGKADPVVVTDVDYRSTHNNRKNVATLPEIMKVTERGVGVRQRHSPSLPFAISPTDSGKHYNIAVRIVRTNWTSIPDFFPTRAGENFVGDVSTEAMERGIFIFIPFGRSRPLKRRLVPFLFLGFL